MITGHGSEEIAVDSIKKGAFNYLTKPVDLSRLKATLESASRAAGMSRENRKLKRELGYDEALDRIIGTNTAVKNLKNMIRQVAGTDASVLIEGDSGTGKELVADAVYALSKRSGLYLKVNTAAIPRELLESELFGHERGAFTGAVQQKQGKFEAADNGTLFLDEIGEMPMDSQVKLLRVLQDGSFNRVGGNDTIATDVRMICATNRNLKGEVLAGRFRMDLYYRLNVVNIRVPSLQERLAEDIPLLTNHFIERLNERHGGHKHASEELLGRLRRMDWPGNIRELENAVEKLYVLSPGKVIGCEHLRLEIDTPAVIDNGAPITEPLPQSTPAPAPTTMPQDPVECPTDPIKALVGLPLDEIERRMILAAPLSTPGAIRRKRLNCCILA